MICKNCGTYNDEGSVVCGNCGTPFTPEAYPYQPPYGNNTQPPQKKNNSTIIAVLGVLLAAAVVVIIVLAVKSNKEAPPETSTVTTNYSTSVSETAVSTTAAPSTTVTTSAPTTVTTATTTTMPVITENDELPVPFYGIFCSAYKNYDDAAADAEKLKGQGFVNAQVLYTTDWSNLNSEPWYVVVAGAYATREEADALLPSVRNVYPDAYVKFGGDYQGP